MRKTKAQLEQEIKELQKINKQLEKEIEKKSTVDYTGINNVIERKRIEAARYYKRILAESDRADKFADYLFWTTFSLGMVIVCLISYIIL